jgi:hypothetical protein
MAHDTLETILRFHKNDFADEDDLINITIMRDSLCWVLDHEDNDTFAKNLKLICSHVYGKGN